MADTAKQTILKAVEQMPDDASADDILYEIYFRQHVDRGLQESAEGKTISDAEVRRSVAKWLRSIGH